MGDLRQLVAGGFANKNATTKDPQTPGMTLPSSPPTGASDGPATLAAGDGGGTLKAGDGVETGPGGGGGGTPPRAVPAPADGSAAAFSDKPQQQQQQRGPTTAKVRAAGWKERWDGGGRVGLFLLL